MPCRSAVLSCALLVTLGSGGLVATSGAASAAGTDDTAGQPTVQVSGTLLQTVKEPHTAGPRYAVRLADDTLVPIKADFDEPPAPQARFRGTLEVPQRVQSALAESGTDVTDGEQVKASSRTGRAVLALVDRSDATMSVDQSQVGAARAVAAPAAGTTHRIFVAVPDNLGYRSRASDATILANLRKDATYWEEQAEGQIAQDVVPTRVVHYNTRVRNAGKDCGLGASFYPMLQEGERLFPGFNEQTDHLVIGIPDRDCAGDVLGLGTVGTGFGTGGGLVATLASGDTVGAVAHEMGHNYGFLHANIRCGSACTDEYAGIYDVMGYGMGSGFNQLTALGTVYRRLNGVRDAGEVVGVAPGSPQTVTFARRSSSTGVRSVAVKDPRDGSVYYVDLRTGLGRDAGAAYARGGVIDGFVLRTGVVVTRAYGQHDDQGQIGTGGMEVVPYGSRTAFRTGEQWVSPSGGVAVRVDAENSESAQVTVARTIPRAPGPRTVGAVRVGSRVSADRGTWSPGTRFSYAWKVGSRVVSRASSWTPTAPARGGRLTVSVTGTLDGFAATTRTSAARVIGYGVIGSTAPRISGTARVGRVLTLVRSRFSPGTSTSATWYVGKRAVSHAGAIRLARSAKGKRVVVRMTGRKAGYATVTRSSPATATVR